MNFSYKKDRVTILIPTHNRHYYLKRILDYYAGQSIAVVVADSSKKAYTEWFPAELSVQYYHLPAYGLPAKIEFCLQQIKTPYVVMCADDDFTIPDAVLKCVDFLEQNKTFAVAQGNALTYRKNKAKQGEIEFTILYKDKLSYTIGDNDPGKRIEQLLKNYRSIFYAVHDTTNLRFAFEGVSTAIQNLYLNEYVTVLPLLKGCYAELPVLFQVREYAEDSDDKMTTNLDHLLSEEKYSSEVESFLQFMTKKISGCTSEEEQTVKRRLLDYLNGFAQSITKSRKLSFKKRVGNKIAKLPFVGNKIIRLNRRLEALKKEDLSAIVRTGIEKAELDIICSVILNHKEALR